MSRVAKKPIIIPENVKIEILKQLVIMKNNTTELKYTIHDAVKVFHDVTNKILTFMPHEGYVKRDGWIQAGTTRSILNAMIIGVTKGFSKKLQLIGVGYRVLLNNNKLVLSLGFSHTIEYVLPVGIIAECVSQTEIIIKGANKQLVGQVAAKLRSYRIPEPYKGKGIRYFNEVILSKEAKKK